MRRFSAAYGSQRRRGVGEKKNIKTTPCKVSDIKSDSVSFVVRGLMTRRAFDIAPSSSHASGSDPHEENQRQKTDGPEYKPTERELSALKNLVARSDSSSSPKIKVSEQEGTRTLAFDHPSQEIGLALLMEALGLTDVEFAYGLFGQLASAGSSRDGADSQGLDFLLSVVKGVEPRDQLEAMLAAQMAAVHMASMTFARRLAQVENLPQQDSAERAFNKLTRTFTTQMEALKRYRTGGEQKVTVQHVSVNEGGQAIVGNVTQASKEKPSDDAGPLAITDARSEPMPILAKRKKAAVPIRRGAKE